MADILTDALKDSLKLIPFLFLTYIAMGFLERATEVRSRDRIKKAGKLGPVWGSLLGSSAAVRIFGGGVLFLYEQNTDAGHSDRDLYVHL